MEWELGREVTPGVIAVLHTYGRDMRWNPHVHALVTERGFKSNGKWADVNFSPYRALRRAWQYHLLASSGFWGAFGAKIRGADKRLGLHPRPFD
jgi:hypothetical protein